MSLSTPMPSFLALPCVVPSTLNFKKLSRGAPQTTFFYFFETPILMQDPQLCSISSIFKSEHSFLIEAHLTTLNETNVMRPSQDDTFHSKILWFLSFHVDHRMENGIILHNNPHLPKEIPLHASISSTNEPGKHQFTPQTPRKWPHRDDTTSQWRNKYSIDSLSLLHKQHISKTAIPRQAPP